MEPAEHLAPSTPMPAPLLGDEDLRRTLDVVLRGTGPEKESAPITQVRRRPSPYYSSFLMEELDVALEDGTALALVLKDLSTRARLEGARRFKPPFLYSPVREIQTYMEILEPHRVGAPKFYGAFTDQTEGRYLLLIERVAGRPLWQVGEFETWRRTARWLAEMHGRLSSLVGQVADPACLLRYDAAFYRLWPDRARQTVGRRARDLSGSTLAAFDRLAGRYDRVVERLLSLPVTFIHGEFYPSNVLIEGEGEAARVRPVDWETAAVAPGLMDLADLSSGKWTAEQREDLAGAYREALPPSEGFEEALNCCRLHRAVQWLGWAPEWSPPPEHANDWLAEVLRLGETLV